VNLFKQKLLNMQLTLINKISFIKHNCLIRC